MRDLFDECTHTYESDSFESSLFGLKAHARLTDYSLYGRVDARVANVTWCRITELIRSAESHHHPLLSTRRNTNSFILHY